MDVGVNYPWFDYGWDFGDSPPTYRGTNPPRWLATIDTDLQRFRQIGISVVRWFILADGLNYGSGANAPHPDTNPQRIGQWRFDDPPAINPNLLAHFEQLLERFERANHGVGRAIKLLPVLVDFHLCQTGIWAAGREDPALIQTVPNADWVKQGRADIINDASKRVRFFDRAFEPLLSVSRTHRSVIYAWDIFNEPEWVTNGWHPHRQMNGQLPIAEAAMRQFIEEAIRRIRASGLKVTVGFNRIETIQQTRIFCDYNQFHYYASGTRRLPTHRFDPRYPGIIGEFATHTSSDIWPDLPASEQHVLCRLRWAARQGYPLVIPWSFRQRDTHTLWNSDVEQDIECFVLRRNCPARCR